MTIWVVFDWNEYFLHEPTWLNPAHTYVKLYFLIMITSDRNENFQEKEYKSIEYLHALSISIFMEVTFCHVPCRNHISKRTWLESDWNFIAVRPESVDLYTVEKWCSQRLGNASLESNDVMMRNYNVTLRRWICVQKRSLFRQVDHLISRFERQSETDFPIKYFLHDSNRLILKLH